MVTTVSTLLFGGCDKPLDTNRTVDSYSSFGEVIYREGCQRVAWTGELAQKAAGIKDTVDVGAVTATAVCRDNMPAPADSPDKLKAIQVQRDLLIATVDLILPKDFLHDMETFLEALLPLQDDGTMENSIKSVADLLDTMYKDPDFTPALARLALRAGYRPTKTAAGLVHTIVEYPNVDDLLGKLLGLIATGGTAETEWKQVVTALSKELRTAQPVPNAADPERTLKLGLNVILSTNPDLGNGTTRPLVQRDFRGLAIPNLMNGQNTPFVDADGDGLADIDTVGHYVDASGKPIDVPPPFPEAGTTDTAMRDPQGRALAADGKTLLYKYLDLDGTVMGGMSREALTLMDPTKDTTLGLVYGASALLGPRATQTKMYMDAAGGMVDSITYNGFDTTQSAVLDLVHAFVQILGDPNHDQSLQATQQLLTKYESPTARLIKAMFDVNDLGKMHPEAQIPSTSIVYDDLAPIIVRILRVPGLAEDLVTALQNPHVKGLAPMMARLMQARNQIDFDQRACSATTTCLLGLCNCAHPLLQNGSDLDGIDPVDRTQDDVDYNQSLMQRIAHLIHDANGAQFCSKAGATVQAGGITLASFPNKCDLFEIDDLALFYILNMASDNIRQDTSREDTYKIASFCEAVKDSTLKPLVAAGGGTLLENQTQLTGFRCYPTPAAMNRSLFLDWSAQADFMHNTTDPIPCTDGDLFKDAHDKSIMAWETTMVNNPAGMVDPAFYNDTFYDAIRPVVDAFAKHDECLEYDDMTGNCKQGKLRNAAKILVDLLAMFHEHWPSPKTSNFGHQYQATDRTMPRFAFTDNIHSYEPLLIQALGSMDIVPAVIDLSPTLTTFTVDGTAGGQPALPVLIGTAQYLFDPAAATPGVAYRDGSVSTVMADGKTPIMRTTPYYMMADAFAHKRTALGAIDVNQANSWKSATSAMVDQMLTVEQKSDGSYQLKNRRMHAITNILVDFVRTRLQSHAQTGDLEDFVHKKLTSDMTDIMGGPVFAAMGDFVAKVEADPDARTQLYNLLQYLMNEAQNDEVFQTALTTLTDQVQMFLDDPDLIPVAHIMGEALNPDRKIVDQQLDLIKRARDLDTRQPRALLTILRNLYKLDANRVYPASNVADVLSEVNRTHPGQGGPLDAGDYKTLIGEVRDFLTDEQRGFLRFIAIVKNRK
jgi:hypothetical protein